MIYNNPKSSIWFKLNLGLDHDISLDLGAVFPCYASREFANGHSGMECDVV